MIAKAARLSFLVALGILCTGRIAFAQDELSSEYKEPSTSSLVHINHTPSRPEELPIPGAEVILSASLADSKELEQRLRLMLVRDGKVIDSSSVTAVFNENDEPTYYFTVNAPQAEMSYQFVLYEKDHTISASKRFRVRRSCVPEITVTESVIPEEIQGKDRLKALVDQSESLEREISSYKEALNILEKLKAMIKG